MVDLDMRFSDEEIELLSGDKGDMLELAGIRSEFKREMLGL